MIDHSKNHIPLVLNIPEGPWTPQVNNPNTKPGFLGVHFTLEGKGFIHVHLRINIDWDTYPLLHYCNIRHQTCSKNGAKTAFGYSEYVKVTALQPFLEIISGYNFSGAFLEFPE